MCWGAVGALLQIQMPFSLTPGDSKPTVPSLVPRAGVLVLWGGSPAVVLSTACWSHSSLDFKAAAGSFLGSEVAQWDGGSFVI